MQFISGLRLYGGTVTAEVDNRDGQDNELGPDDRILRFEIEGSGLKRSFPTTADTSRDEFNRWVKANAEDLLRILFPTSLSEGASGRDAAQNHSQQFLLNTALAVTAVQQAGQPRRSEAGGLFEFEQFDGDGRSGIGLQGLYRIGGAHMSLLGRYAQQNQNEQGPFGATTTHAVTIATDFHPSVAVNRTLDWRVGVDARTGLLFSRASNLNFGSLDFGGGVWTSARKDFSRVRIGAGGLFQGSKSYVPSAIVGDDLEFLATAINNRDVMWDFSYGVLGGFLITERTSLNGKVLQTKPVNSAIADARPGSTIVMASISYLVGGLTPVDVGYKVSTGGGRVTAHSIFLQGYFGF
jgi:hypothetical protein